MPAENSALDVLAAAPAPGRVGQQYCDAQGNTYTWNGSLWVPSRQNTDVPAVALSATNLHRYEPDTGFYNLTPNTVRRARAAAGKLSAGTARFPMAVAADSTGQGAGSGTNATQRTTTSWPAQLRQRLIAQGMADGGLGLMVANSSLNDPRVTQTGTWSSGTTAIAASSSTAGSTKTFTSTTPGTAVDLYYLSGNSNVAGTFTYSIDGAAAVTVNTTSTGSPGTLQKTTVSGLSNANHTVVVTQATGVTYFTGAEVYVPGAGFAIHNLGIAGITGVQWEGFGDYTSNAAVLNALAPALTFVMLGLNDYSSQNALATYLSNITAIAQTALNAGSDVILVAQWQRNDTGSLAIPQASYVSQLYAIADSLNVAVLDLWTYFGSYATTNALGLYAADQVHFVTAGYAAVTRALLNGLSLVMP